MLNLARQTDRSSDVQAGDWRPHRPTRGQAGDDRTTDIGGFFRILGRRWPSIVVSALAGLALALAYLATTTPVYTASTSLFIDPRVRSVVPEDQPGYANNLAADQALVESQLEIITSDAVLRRVVKTEKLASDPEFAPPPAAGLTSRLKAILVPRPAPADPETRAIVSLAEAIKVKRAQKTYVVEVEVSSSSPVKAARLTRAVVAAYLEDQAAAKSDEARRANKLIDGRLDELRKQLRLSETRIDDYKKANKILSSQGGLVSEQLVTRLNSELVTARAVAAEAKGRLDLVEQALKNGGSPEYLPDAIRSALVQKLREQFAQVARREAALATQLQSRHPVLIEARSQLQEIKAQINAELKRVSTSARSEYQVSANRVDELSRTLEQAKEDVARSNTAQIRLRELEQDAAASRDLLNTFLSRAKQTQEQQNLAVAEARVISPASVPTRPSKPLNALILSLGLLGGLAIGLSRAILLDHLRNTTPEARNEASLTVLGALPSLAATGPLQRVMGFGRGLGGRGDDVDFSDVMTAIASGTPSPTQRAFASAARRIAARLRTPSQSDHPSIVTLLSAGAGRGTSATALALAYTGALARQRVLLVDAASTNAALSAVLANGLDTRGVIVLDNKSHLKSIVRRDARSGLAFLPIALADLRTLRPQQRKRLATGFYALAQDFDLVIVDGGAILEDASASALLPITDRVVLVAREGEERSGRIAEAAEVLASLDADVDVAGVVLTMARSMR